LTPEGLNSEGDSIPDCEDILVEEYLSSARIKLLLIALLFIIAAIIAIYSFTIYGDMELSYVFELISNHISGNTYPEYSPEWFDDIIIWESALPRVIFCIIAAIGLAVAGASMQTAMNNPLADPYTVGISSGACLGLAVALSVGFSVNHGDLLGINIFAFIFSLFPLALILILAPKTHSSPSTLILAGVALSYLFNAANTIIMVTVDAETLETIYKWQVGTVSDIRWDNIPLTLGFVALGSALVTILSKKLNLLSLGDASATSLGVDPDNLRMICLVAIAFIVGAIVGSAGIIGFIGLVTPHIVRTFVGSNNKYVIPASAGLGIIMIITADILCKMFTVYDDMPVGAMLALIGAPIFLYLIIRRKSNVW
jgi:iron complex transport system permease protein